MGKTNGSEEERSVHRIPLIDIRGFGRTLNPDNARLWLSDFCPGYMDLMIAGIADADDSMHTEACRDLAHGIKSMVWACAEAIATNRAVEIEAEEPEDFDPVDTLRGLLMVAQGEGGDWKSFDAPSRSMMSAVWQLLDSGMERREQDGGEAQ